MTKSFSDPAASGVLEPGDVHLFTAHIGEQDRPPADLLHFLSPAERGQAERFHFDIHRHRYIYAHAALHLLLARYLLMPPESIVLEAGRFGKPFVGNPRESTSVLHFNMSHSADLALYAFARDVEVGVDTEFIDLELSIRGLAETVFTASELAVLYARPAAEQHSHFFDLWARKEAYAKALGMGLQLPFKELEIGHRGVVSGVYIKPFQPRENFAGAVATRAKMNHRPLQDFRFDEFL